MGVFGTRLGVWFLGVWPGVIFGNRPQVLVVDWVVIHGPYKNGGVVVVRVVCVRSVDVVGGLSWEFWKTGFWGFGEVGVKKGVFWVFR